MLLSTIKNSLDAFFLTLIAFTFFINGGVNAMEFTSKKTDEMLSYQTVGSGKPLVIILETAVQDDKVMQDFELESLLMGGDHSQKVKAPPIRSGYGLKDCVTLSSSTAVSRIIPDETSWDAALQDLLGKHYQLIILDNKSLFKPSAASDAIANLIQALGFDHSYVLALSKGSLIAEQLVIHHPEVIEKLILCAPCLEGMNLQALTAFKAPTLLAGGRDDATASPEHLKKIAAYIPHAWTAYFEGDHEFLFQDRKHFADLVVLFLGQR
jgi:pimeloyl-ACP methyl ester carboxylesterase